MVRRILFSLASWLVASNAENGAGFNPVRSRALVVDNVAADAQMTVREIVEELKSREEEKDLIQVEMSRLHAVGDLGQVREIAQVMRIRDALGLEYWTLSERQDRLVELYQKYTGPCDPRAESELEDFLVNNAMVEEESTVKYLHDLLATDEVMGDSTDYDSQQEDEGINEQDL